VFLKKDAIATEHDQSESTKSEKGGNVALGETVELGGNSRSSRVVLQPGLPVGMASNELTDQERGDGAPDRGQRDKLGPGRSGQKRREPKLDQTCKQERKD